MGFVSIDKGPGGLRRLGGHKCSTVDCLTWKNEETYYYPVVRGARTGPLHIGSVPSMGLLYVGDSTISVNGLGSEDDTVGVVNHYSKDPLSFRVRGPGQMLCLGI